MTSNVSLDSKLDDEVLKLTGARARTPAATKALEEFVAVRKRKELLELMDKLEWDNTYDFKSERSQLSATQMSCATAGLVGSV